MSTFPKVDTTPTRRRQGGPTVPGPVAAEPDPREVIVPLSTPYSWQSQVHTAAIDNLADAIRELARAITSRNPSPSEAVPPDSASPGPAKGLTTQIRPTPDHREHHSRKYFGPVTAGGDQQ